MHLLVSSSLHFFCLPSLDCIWLPQKCPPWWFYLRYMPRSSSPRCWPSLLLISAWSFHTSHVCIWHSASLPLQLGCLFASPITLHATSTPSWPFPLTPRAGFLEPHISPSSVFLFLSSPQPDSPPGQVPPGGPRGWHSGAGVPCFREAQAHHPVVAGR